MRPCCVVTPFVGSAGASVPTVVRPFLNRSRSHRLVCHALENWGQPSVTNSGTDAKVLPFEITSDKTDPQLVPAASKEPAAAALGDSVQDAADETWETWLKVFEQMDQAFDQQEHLRLQLRDAVRTENYSRAAELKHALAAVQRMDEVAAVRAALSDALKQERYADAVVLRDQGMAWMQGWWCGLSENDPVGHLMYVAPEFGRYTGRVFTARDLADLAGLRDNASSGLQQLRSVMMQADSSTLGSSGSSRTVGSPALEVFVTRRGGPGGELTHQVVSLIGGPAGAVGKETVVKAQRGVTGGGGGGVSAGVEGANGEVASSLASMLGLGPLMLLSVVVEPDGMVKLRVVPVADDGKSVRGGKGVVSPVAEKRVGRHLTGWEAVEAEETLKALALDNVTGKDKDGVDEGKEGKNAMDAIADVIEDLAGKGDGKELVVDVVVVENTGVKQVEVVREEVLSDSELELVAEALDSLQGNGTQLGEGDAAGQMVVDVGAARAVEIDATRVDEDGSESESDEVGTRSDRVGMPLNGVGAGGKDDGASGSLFTELHRSPAELQRLGMDQFALQLPLDTPNASGTGAAGGSGADGQQQQQQQLVRFEILVPAGQMSGGGARAQAAVSAVAERVARAQARASRKPVDTTALRAALQSAMKNLESGQPTDITIPSTSSRDAEDDVQQGDGNASARMVRYSRVPPETAPKSDPFSGLYVGSFGPHGPELLRLKRMYMDGEEMVEATKVTGDPNVPAGTVSFRAKIGRKHKQSASQVYPDELGVTARYKGQGRVAAKGYSKPKWVEGELLVFSSSSPLTNGAQLGFVWHVPGERKFLILLNKIDLEACAERAL